MHIPQTETLKITYFLQPCARRAPRNPPNYIYSQSVGIIYAIFFNILEFGICPQSRMSSKSRPQSRVLKVVCPHCPIVHLSRFLKTSNALYVSVLQLFVCCISSFFLTSVTSMLVFPVVLRQKLLRD